MTDDEMIIWLSELNTFLDSTCTVMTGFEPRMPRRNNLHKWLWLRWQRTPSRIHSVNSNNRAKYIAASKGCQSKARLDPSRYEVIGHANGADQSQTFSSSNATMDNAPVPFLEEAGQRLPAVNRNIHSAMCTNEYRGKVKRYVGKIQRGQECGLIDLIWISGDGPKS